MQKLLIDLKAFYKTQGRHGLPWRKTRDPYKILVSEVMLQQTQVQRVIPFYKNFIKGFPTAKALARAPLSKVLQMWSGLGYNRRAKYLHAAAKEFGTKPLEELPGVGPYTAKAVSVFAFNKPEVLVETNIRTVFIYYFFKKREKVSDKEIMPLIEKVLKKSRMQPRHFYAALMDYGSYLKQKGVKLNTKSKHYIKQPAFKGSSRELRGSILKLLLAKPLTFAELYKATGRPTLEIRRALEVLSTEELVALRGKRFVILS